MTVTTMQKTDCHLRWMIRRDLSDVLDIEWCSFRDYWSEADFIRCLQQRNCIGTVAEVQTPHRIAGFVLYELHRTRLNIINFAVHPNYRRKGVGSALIRKAQSKLSEHRRTRITVTLRESNLDGQLFLRTLGFKAVFVLRGHYDDGDDGYVFAFKVKESIVP